MNKFNEIMKRIKKNQREGDPDFRTEADLEKYLCREVEKIGGWAVKFVSPSANGLPDRIVFYSCETWLIELKYKGGKVQPHQKQIHKKLAGLGHPVWVIQTKHEVDTFIQILIEHSDEQFQKLWDENEI